MDDRTQQTLNQLGKRGGIDPAALAAATLASAVSTIAQSGPYTPISSVVAISILCVILAYDVDASRTSAQSFAYSAVLALTATLGLGYPLELIFGPSVDLNTSSVPQLASVTVWGLAVLGFLGMDRKARKQ
ncbi:hypothetical protein PTW32_15970 [Dechloromonas agitata]|uniref:hypothetical protein n=1 Tax=Dechloromonas agitata TaxID=73030 RepID=UPI00237E32E4|nr:hypothetical protein [Dechloromonas agitata]MDE1546914.1 hypothetical protein [Dechloromonas agitata]